MPALTGPLGVPGAPAPDVSVVVVNFNSASYVQALLATIQSQQVVLEGRPAEIEVIIVDNASAAHDRPQLESLLGSGVRLLRNGENVGYALANNQGFHLARGRWHVVCNPDVELEPGCLQTLIAALEDLPEAALVGPLASMDRDGLVLLPPNELPDPYLESLGALARRYPALARYNLRRRARLAHTYWTAESPLRLSMLSGGCFMGRRSTFLEQGLFDPGYPLYYEDTDLFRRFHQAGLALYHVPGARILHHFSRSAITRMKAALYRHQVSARRYFERWFGPAGRRCHEIVNARADQAGLAAESPFPLSDCSASDTAPVLELPSAQAYVEVAGNPQFTLAVGILPEVQGPWRLPAQFWSQLGAGTYWVRAADQNSHETLRAWRITKCPKM